MIKIYQKKINDSKISELESFRPGCWIRAINPDEKELKELEKEFGLDFDILNDALDPYEVPRVEQERGVAYIFVRGPQTSIEKINTSPLLIAVGPDFVLTLSASENPVLSRFINNGLSFTTTQKTQLLLRFLSEIMKAYNGFVTSISKDVRQTGDKFIKINEKIIINFVNSEEVLNDFLMALTHASPILQNLAGGKIIKLYKEDQELVEDLLLHTNQLIELCKSTLKNIVNIREAYSTIITNDLNKVIKLFTSLTVVLTIPTIIASLYGMNVALPFGEQPQAFWIILVLIGSMVAGAFYIFSRNRWL